MDSGGHADVQHPWRRSVYTSPTMAAAAVAAPATPQRDPVHVRAQRVVQQLRMHRHTTTYAQLQQRTGADLRTDTELLQALRQQPRVVLREDSRTAEYCAVHSGVRCRTDLLQLLRNAVATATCILYDDAADAYPGADVDVCQLVQTTREALVVAHAGSDGTRLLFYNMMPEAVPLSEAVCTAWASTATDPQLALVHCTQELDALLLRRRLQPCGVQRPSAPTRNLTHD